ncbi:MAG TPA: hypothetical protein VGZ68_08985 [Acidimicrobiales bacterium]|nr:hypothetical protein [Acidimicrobiales bacterium]
MSDEPKAPLTTTTSLWPAAAVLGVAVVMLVVFMVINLVANQGVTKLSAAKTPVVVGGLKRDLSPNPALTYCRQGQEVPSNIDDAFLVPVHTVARPGATTPNLGAGDFDCTQPMTTTHASSSSLIGFFNAQLEARGWNLFSKGASNGDAQSLFQKAGSDGFYWEVGVTVTKTTASSVEWTFQIYQNSETV